MPTTTPSRIDLLRQILDHRMKVDRLIPWIRLGLYSALACGIVWIAAMIILGGAANPATPGDDGGVTRQQPELLKNIDLVKSWLFLLSIILFTAWTLRRNKTSAVFNKDLQDPASLEIEPLDGEIIAGLQCSESSPTRYAWTALRPVWISTLEPALVVLVLCPPALIRVWYPLFRGESWSSVGLSGVLNSSLVIVLTLFVWVITLRSRRVQQIAIEHGKDEPRLRLVLAGVMSKETIEVSAADIVAFSVDSRPRLEYRDRMTGAARTLALPGPSSNPIPYPFDHWQYRRLFHELRRRLGLSGERAASAPNAKARTG